MSLTIARCANRLGMPKAAERIAIRLYGEPLGKISKTGRRGFYGVDCESGARLVTVLDKNYNLFSQTMRSETGDVVTRFIYDKKCKVIKGTECVKRGDKVFHKIVKPGVKQESWGEWIYNYKTGDKQVITNDDKILDAII